MESKNYTSYEPLTFTVTLDNLEFDPIGHKLVLECEARAVVLALFVVMQESPLHVSPTVLGPSPLPASTCAPCNTPAGTPDSAPPCRN